ncbi:class I SAM-dependent methyltransferase [Pseudarthrobacter cellobiosi]|uniref:class I SAM-dependent methyltransferase n=1 Tax=Pseudarthrobacter cellobiosi TaxID=2953654 RepID=UPI00208EFF1C|nr:MULTISPECIES: class I SAM-dependent methyltransferase [unclassified Pseudarthrobacter]MCO4253982.1 methyltransferase domain-containing protein [Pseudarthrobacter sp. HLT1-5]MCO4273384.1 methyltransferase domain-containing protein [Pseudarthrobacter sp. HLT3-5]
MTDAEVEIAYSRRAAEYIARFGSVESTHPADRKLIAEWVAPLVGPVLDVGCGPGHWTKFLADQGAAVEGIDLVPALSSSKQKRLSPESHSASPPSRVSEFPKDMHSASWLGTR